jgi:hypothetical protein
MRCKGRWGLEETITDVCTYSPLKQDEFIDVVVDNGLGQVLLLGLIGFKAYCAPSTNSTGEGLMID